MKLTPTVNVINVKLANFSYERTKSAGKKCAQKTLVKLTPSVLPSYLFNDHPTHLVLDNNRAQRVILRPHKTTLFEKNR